MSDDPVSAWEIVEEDYGDELWFGGTGHGLICVNGWANGGCKKNETEWEKLQAEARLIAAAPTLLARIRELEAALAESRRWHEGGREVARLLTERAERAEAERDALRALLADLHGALRDRHYGRMPEEVQRAYDAAGAALREGDR